MKLRKGSLRYWMMNAKSPELIDCACRLGMNWVVAASSGQKGGQVENDPPVYMRTYEKLRPIRQRRRGLIEAETKRVAKIIDYAKRRGCKVIYNTYEPSLPEGFVSAYPRIVSKPIDEYRRCKHPEIQRSRNLCVARPAVRQALAAKIAEIIHTFPNIDGICYTNNESSSTTKVWHRCEFCRNIPYPQMMTYLHEAMRDGIRSSGVPVKLFYRCWGTHEVPDQYWKSYERRLRFGGTEAAGKEWIADHVECFAPDHLHFVPDRDIPQFIRMIRDDDCAVICKATWADVNLHHPLNPWVGRYTGHDQICEISFEHCRNAPHVFYIVAKEMQRRVRHAMRRGVDGLCGVPVFWGVHDVRPSAYTPSEWSLAELNLHLFGALVKDPDTDLENTTDRFLRKRYGSPLPPELSKMLLQTEDIAAAAFNIRGVQATGDGLAQFYYQILRYGPMYADWEKRVYPSPENLKRIFAAKDRNVRRAEKMLARIDQLKGKLPPRAHKEFRMCFANLLTLTNRWCTSHKHSLTLWGIKEGTIQPTTRILEQLHRYAHQSATLRETISP